jgi:hypothetical protein
MIRNYMIKLAQEGNFKAIPEPYRAKLEEKYKKEDSKKEASKEPKKDDKDK